MTAMWRLWAAAILLSILALLAVFLLTLKGTAIVALPWLNEMSISLHLMVAVVYSCGVLVGALLIGTYFGLTSRLAGRQRTNFNDPILAQMRDR